MSTSTASDANRVSLWVTCFLITPLSILGVLFGETKFVWLIPFAILTIDKSMIKVIIVKGSLRTKTLLFFTAHVLCLIGFYSINPSFILGSVIASCFWGFLAYEEILKKIKTYEK